MTMYIDPNSVTAEQLSYTPQSPLEWSKQALLYGHSAPAKAMAKMKLLRGVEFRSGRNEINIFQIYNSEAALAYTRGQVRESISACQSCLRGNGPFAKCVVIQGYMKGSCSNCHYNSERSRCSFYNGNGRKRSRSQKRVRQDTILDISDTPAKKNCATREPATMKAQIQGFQRQNLASLLKNISELLDNEVDE